MSTETEYWIEVYFRGKWTMIGTVMSKADCEVRLPLLRAASTKTQLRIASSDQL